MFTEEDLGQARRLLDDLGVVHFEFSGIVRMLDDTGEPLEPLTPPPSLERNVPGVWSGLQYLRRAKPDVALLLTLHANGRDFDRLQGFTSHILGNCPVCGIEAWESEVTPRIAEIPQPGMYTPYMNPWMHEFQMSQFAWLRANRVFGLPCEPEIGEAFATLQSARSTFDKLHRHTEDFGLTDGARQIVMYVLDAYDCVFRGWAIVGEFGRLLQLPGVVSLLTTPETMPRIPLVLGAAHVLTEDILQEYCGLDLVVITSDRKESDSGLGSRARRNYRRRLASATTAHRFTVPDLLSTAYPFP